MGRDELMGLVEQMVAQVFRQVRPLRGPEGAGRGLGGPKGAGRGARRAWCAALVQPAPAGVQHGLNRPLLPECPLDSQAPASVPCNHALCLLPPQVVGVELQPPFRRMSYAEAMGKYASGERPGCSRLG